MIDMILLVIAKLLAGWLIADLLGGVLHWLEDRVLTERTPFLGATVVASNRLHHREPMAFAARSVVARNGTTWLAAGVVSLMWLALFGPSLVWFSATIGGAVSSSVHFLTHQPRLSNRAIRILQEIGLVQSAAHHAGHHRPPSNRRYCPLTSWVNPVVDGFGIWRLLEQALHAIGIPLAIDA
ncbi:fatty acid desaturase CarF family protein [Sphingomonas sp. UV9]|uniref:fatty acid desaturase CarF family protein n=1 Tax=Sphingomonas sp. UV9 TaxID=1851410 RepID=UPI0013E8EC3C|nr:fatty acid desaturase CarF family protein [Sphingomonas sp. UV9]